MPTELINQSVSAEAKQVLRDFQEKHNIRGQGNALERLLLEFKEFKRFKECEQE